MKKIILDLCGGTGSWSKPYAEADYDVRVITLPAHDVLTYQPPIETHGILAAPPCTMFSIARQVSKIPRDLRAGMTTVEACLRIIWECRYQGTLKWWALENPVGYLRQFLGKPSLTFQPYYYGDAYTKRTDLWGYFTRPRRSTVRVPKGWVWEHIKSQGTLKRQEVRAVTPPGFAHAFFESNP